MSFVILRLPEVVARTGRRKSSTYADIKSGLFVSPVSIGERAVGWPDSEVEAINGARIAGQTKDQIRELVRQLEAKRKVAT